MVCLTSARGHRLAGPMNKLIFDENAEFALVLCLIHMHA